MDLIGGKLGESDFLREEAHNHEPLTVIRGD